MINLQKTFGYQESEMMEYQIEMKSSNQINILKDAIAHYVLQFEYDFKDLRDDMLEFCKDMIYFYKHSLSLPHLLDIREYIESVNYFNRYDFGILDRIENDFKHDLELYLDLDKLIRHYVKYNILSYYKVFEWILKNSENMKDFENNIRNHVRITKERVKRSRKMDSMNDLFDNMDVVELPFGKAIMPKNDFDSKNLLLRMLGINPNEIIENTSDSFLLEHFQEHDCKECEGYSDCPIRKEGTKRGLI